MYEKTPPTLPPLHVPPPLQLISTCGARIVSGYVPLRAILRRSFSEESVPNAQHEPQYCGMCWLRLSVKKLVPLMSRQSQSAGRSATLSV